MMSVVRQLNSENKLKFELFGQWRTSSGAAVTFYDFGAVVQVSKTYLLFCKRCDMNLMMMMMMWLQQQQEMLNLKKSLNAMFTWTVVHPTVQ